MRTLIAAALACAAGLAWSTSAAQARDYRYCLYEGFDTAGDCYYSTYAQCMASASGRVAYCNINPMYRGEPAKPPRQRRKTRPQRY